MTKHAFLLIVFLFFLTLPALSAAISFRSGNPAKSTVSKGGLS